MTNANKMPTRPWLRACPQCGGRKIRPSALIAAVDTAAECQSCYLKGPPGDPHPLDVGPHVVASLVDNWAAYWNNLERPLEWPKDLRLDMVKAGAIPILSEVEAAAVWAEGLKLCPFCAEGEAVTIAVSTPGNPKQETIFVSCDKCREYCETGNKAERAPEAEPVQFAQVERDLASEYERGFNAGAASGARAFKPEPAAVNAEGLKPCPFCGEAEALTRLGNPKQETAFILCDKCGASSGIGAGGDFWNKRAPRNRQAPPERPVNAEILARKVSPKSVSTSSDFRG